MLLIVFFHYLTSSAFLISFKQYLSFINPERGGFGVIFPEVMIFSDGFCPEENIITEGNIAESPERRVYK
jgi:hypothetical protein